MLLAIKFCILDAAPDGGKRVVGVEEGTDYKTYVIPIASALFGCCCGAISVWLYRKRELRLRSSVNGGLYFFISYLFLARLGHSFSRTVIFLF